MGGPVREELRVVTACGDFRVVLDHDRAPKTCEYFSALVRDKRLDGSSVFRIVTPVNEPADDAGISIVQLGLTGRSADERAVVPHESTRETGLRHLQWTVSAARFRCNELYGSFFVCLRDEPSLDYQGSRNPDGQGFAAFGRVVSGFDTLQDLFRRAEATPILSAPVPVYTMELLQPGSLFIPAD